MVNAFPLTAEPFQGTPEGAPVALNRSANLFSVLLVGDDDDTRPATARAERLRVSR